MSDSEPSEDDVCWSESDSDDEQTTTGAWKPNNCNRVHVHVDNVDTLLLAKAREEVQCVVRRLLLRMFGTTQHSAANVRISRIVLTWLDSPIMSKLQQFVSVNLEEAASVTFDELFEFLEVELWLIFYHVTPGFFFSKENRFQYPPAAGCMPLERYRTVLIALGKTSSPKPEDASQWTAPFSTDRNTTHVAELVRRLCADIGFVSGTTIASLDDDLIRLRSASVDDIGLAHVRNPKKGYGPVQHGIVSLVTGLFLGGHVAARGESTVDIVRILQRSLCGASTESHICLPGIVHALDRGYQSNAVNQQIANVGGSIIGTHKRTGRFPFTFRKNPSQHQQLISEKGERAAYWASMQLPIHPGTLPVHAHALAYRSGLGKVALGYTTMETAGPGYWTDVTSPSSRRRDRHEDDFFSAFEAKVQLLTMSQRTPDWFVLRKFRITGSVAAKLFKVIARCGDDSTTDDSMIDPASDPDVNTIILLLSLQQRRQTSRDTQEVLNGGAGSIEHSLSREELMKKKCGELKCMCREAFVPVSGRKSDLVNRLLGVSTEAAPEQDTSAENARFIIDEALLSAWFMAPFSTQDTKIGSANEDNIAGHITSYLDKCSGYHLEKLKSYGLLCRRGMPVAALSPDEIASVLHTQRGRFHAIMEYKTHTTARTVQSEQALAAAHGIFTTVEATATGFGRRLCDVIPDPSHRLQLLHNIVCGGVQDGFLVYASASSIIRVIHVAVDYGVSWTYCAALDAIHKGYLGWIYCENRAAPRFDPDQLRHCIDQRTLEQSLILWKALVKMVDDRSQPRSTFYQLSSRFGIVSRVASLSTHDI